AVARATPGILSLAAPPAFGGHAPGLFHHGPGPHDDGRAARAAAGRRARGRAMPGPGVTNMISPTTSSAPPTTNTTARLLLRQMNRMSAPTFSMRGQATGQSLSPRARVA